MMLSNLFHETAYLTINVSSIFSWPAQNQKKDKQLKKWNLKKIFLLFYRQSLILI